MNIVESSKQAKYTVDDAMKDPNYAQKISDAVNAKLKDMGYSEQKIRTFLLHKQLKLNKCPDRLDVTLNSRHLFYAVIAEIKVGSYKAYSIDIVE